MERSGSGTEEARRVCFFEASVPVNLRLSVYLSVCLNVCLDGPQEQDLDRPEPGLDLRLDYRGGGGCAYYLVLHTPY